MAWRRRSRPGSRSGGAYWRDDQIVNNGFYPGGLRGIDGSQFAGRVIIDIAGKRNHSVDRLHLNGQSRKRIFRGNLAFDLRGDLIVVDRGGLRYGGCRLRHRCWRCGLFVASGTQQHGCGQNAGQQEVSKMRAMHGEFSLENLSWKLLVLLV
jgi:hypothetical protein